MVGCVEARLRNFEVSDLLLGRALGWVVLGGRGARDGRDGPDLGII
jgi:hypothetical protein